MSRYLALVLALVGAPAIAEAGPCAMRPALPQVLTRTATAIAKQGGILVGLTGAGGDPEAGEVTTWRLRDGKQRVTPVATTLAPGLVSLELPAGGDAIVLESAKQVSLVTVKRGGTANLLAAPRVRKVWAQTTPGGPRSSPTNEIVVELIAAAPTEALALVIFGIDKQATVARSWTTVDDKALSFMVYHSAGRCETTVPGTIVTSQGDHVAFAWVDRSGRLSTMSAELVVGAGSPSPRAPGSGI